MKILIIGGTRFLGRALTEAIVDQGHELTLFHRGQSNPDYRSEVPRILGDRETDIEKLAGHQWDVVIDTCGYFPRIVQISADYLKDKVNKYVFISSISAYKSTDEIGITEAAELDRMDDPTLEEITGESYGPLKVLCEEVVQEQYGENAIIIRPGLIIGPHDPTNRFTYWVNRMRGEGPVLAPGDGTFPVQVIDARDIADFILTLLDNDETGTFNVVGPDQPMPLNEVLSVIADAVNNHPDITWIENEWLLDHDVTPWMEMPLWIPNDEGAALMQVNIDHAKNKGMTFRPLSQTIKDLADWYDSISGDNQEWGAGMSSDKEKELLKTYQSS